ncbi:hypothetical protein [Rhodococcus chondri]|uniref:Integral membrane protein n=1 Tax=Rhodococcus chondri TaxID=3065941 RepID=A0ABU7JQY1_9NOCA|nr:hypothetical protein [Rhodococcus sp. CC-R104]MEE2032438.1 hypothetical protein [Rhodococcus sp. CC-R104]
MGASVDGDRLFLEFPTVHADAELTVSFHRTVRVPDDGRSYPLPPSLGRFPLRVVEGGLVLPVWQSEACWIKFDSRYPFLVKVGSGRIDAVTGRPWNATPDFEAEDYFEVPAQPWIDGFCVAQGTVRQFVAAPLGRGDTVEEQLASGTPLGGVQIVAYPIRPEIWDERKRLEVRQPIQAFTAVSAPMGFGAGGAIDQGIATPVEPSGAWDLDHRSTVHVRLANSAEWETLTGSPPPTEPTSAAEYTKRGFPWFELYDEGTARQGSPELAEVETVTQRAERRGDEPPAGNESIEVPEPIRIRRRRERPDPI